MSQKINRNMGCIEICSLSCSIALLLLINRNMGCIEIDLDSISDIEPVWINRNMGCIEITQSLKTITQR